MTLEMWITLAILAIAIVLFVTEWLRVDVVAIGVVISLLIAGVLNVEEALSGFSSTAVITITALFVVGGAVMHTGLAGMIGRAILRVAGTHPTRLLVVTMLSTAFLSGFMSDTGTVAVLMPAIIGLSVAAKIPPSKLLIPLAFGSLLGGAMTLIGTPPNIIVSDVLAANGYAPFNFFSYTPLGVALLIGGVIFMAITGRWLLPSHQPERNIQPVNTPQELVDLYRLPESLFRVRVRKVSDLVGKTLAECALSNNFGVTVIEIQRQNGGTSNGNVPSIHPESDTVIKANDLLIVRGETGKISQMAAQHNLGIQPAEASDKQRLVTHEVGIAEVVLPPRSHLIDKNLVDLNFGRTYHLTVLNLHRPNHTEPLDLKTTSLRFGDTLLVQGEWRNISALRRNRRDFVVIGEPEQSAPPPRGRAILALIILMAMLVVMIFEILPLVTASLLAALAMVLLGCLSMDQAYDAVSWKSIVLIAGMWPMSIALQKVGLVAVAADALSNSAGMLGPLAVLAAIYLFTAVFTQVLSNTATAVLVAPIALAVAQQLGLQPQAFLMAVGVAASMAFASPVASPVNTLVMGAGNYRFADYLKVGLPMLILSLIISVLILPLLFPF